MFVSNNVLVDLLKCCYISAAVTEAVLEQCVRVLKLLDSHVLHTETRVLREILYVMHNSFRQHKPFRAIKQVYFIIVFIKLSILNPLFEVFPAPNTPEETDHDSQLKWVCWSSKPLKLGNDMLFACVCTAGSAMYNPIKGNETAGSLARSAGALPKPNPEVKQLNMRDCMRPA